MLNQKIGENILWNMVGSLFYMGILWLLTILVVRLSPDYRNAGILSLGMSLYTALWGVSTLNLRTFQVADRNRQFEHGDFIYARIITCAISVILCAAVTLINGYEHYTMLCVILFMIFKVSESFADTFHAIDQKVWRLDIAGKSFLMRGVLVLITFAAGMCIFKSLLIAIIGMSIAVYLVLILYDIPQAKRCIGQPFVLRKDRFIALLKIGIPLGTYSILLNLLAVVPRLSLERHYGETILGVFSSVSTPTTLVQQVATFVFSPLVSLFSDFYHEKNLCKFKQLFYKIMVIILTIGFVAIISGNICGEWALVLLFGTSIRPYAHLLVPLLVVAMLTAVVWFFCYIVTVFEYYGKMAVYTTISFLSSLACSEFFVLRYEMMGAVIAITVGLTVECILLATCITIAFKNNFKQ